MDAELAGFLGEIDALSQPPPAPAAITTAAAPQAAAPAPAASVAAAPAYAAAAAAPRAMPFGVRATHRKQPVFSFPPPRPRVKPPT